MREEEESREKGALTTTVYTERGRLPSPALYISVCGRGGGGGTF